MPSRPGSSNNHNNLTNTRPFRGSKLDAVICPCSWKPQLELTNFGSTPTTTHVSADLPLHSPTIPMSAHNQPGAGNETGPEPKQEIVTGYGQVLESTAHFSTAGAASAQRKEEVSQHTRFHLLITSIDSHIPPPHSALNSSFTLPPAHSTLNSSFVLPLHTHRSALLPVNDIPSKQHPVHHSVALGHAFNAPSHPPRTQNDQLTTSRNSLMSLKSTACTPSCAGRHSSLNHHRWARLQLQTARYTTWRTQTLLPFSALLQGRVIRQRPAGTCTNFSPASRRSVHFRCSTDPPMNGRTSSTSTNTRPAVSLAKRISVVYNAV